MCAPIMAVAQDPVRLGNFQTAYQGWLDRHGISGSAVFVYRGTFQGNVGPATPREMASVGKSITALCAAALADAGRLGFDENVRQVLGDGPDVTVANLVTHTSGLVDDITQPLMPEWLDTDGHRARDVLDFVQEPTGEVGDFVYNNVNYALLGLVIEAKTEQPVEDTCRDAVLIPAGAHGRASARSGAFLSWGGWSMTPQDFAKVHGYWFGAGKQSSVPAKEQTRPNTGIDPLAYPHVALGNGFFYGLGTFFRANHTGDGTFNFWHFGALCFPERLNVGSYAVTWGGDWTVVATYDACVDDATMLGLDQVMGQAAYGALE